jgi:hypothetical protein
MFNVDTKIVQCHNIISEGEVTMNIWKVAFVAVTFGTFMPPSKSVHTLFDNFKWSAPWENEMEDYDQLTQVKPFEETIREEAIEKLEQYWDCINKNQIRYKRDEYCLKIVLGWHI